MIEEKFATRTRNSIGKIRANRQDLSFEQLQIYDLAKGKKLNSQFKRNLELLTPAGELNYAGYLLADENNLSVKVAKYRGDTKVDLIESNEYGYTSLVKATKSVLDKVDIENRTHIQITGKERIETPLWNKVAVREAIINAFVHSDYTREIAPTVEIFSDRIQITSAGSLMENVSEEEFFEGISVPRNKELMRIYKDLDLVEHLGSGIPRILEFYDKSVFVFSQNFLRMVFPFSPTAIKKGSETGSETGSVMLENVIAYEQLTHRQKQVVQLIIDNPKITYDELKRQLKIKSDRGIANHTEKLKQLGTLTREGTYDGQWIIHFQVERE